MCCVYLRPDTTTAVADIVSLLLLLYCCTAVVKPTAVDQYQRIPYPIPPIHIRRHKAVTDTRHGDHEILCSWNQELLFDP